MRRHRRAVLAAALSAGALLAGGQLRAEPLADDEREPFAEVAKCAVGGIEGAAAGQAMVASARTGTVDLFMTNSKDAAPGWFKETVAITAGSGKLCSGVLVAPDAVLTAAHCVCSYHLDVEQNPAAFVTFGLEVDVATGQKSKGSSVEINASQTRMLDAQTCLGMRWKGDAYLRGDDVALLFLKEPIGNPASARPAPPARAFIPPHTDAESAPPDGKQPGLLAHVVPPAMIASPNLMLTPGLRRLLGVGFGLGEEGKQAGRKRVGCIDIRSRICGSPSEQQYYGCAGGKETVLVDPAAQRDTCGGDSGGPVFAVTHELVRDPKDASGSLPRFSYALVGITSRAAGGGTCGKGGIYTLITPRVVAWLRANGVAVTSYELPNQ